METPANIFSHQTLSWAISRTGLSPADLDKKLKVKGGTVEKWKQGASAPSIPQAKRLAKAAFVPFPMLLLDTPPTDTIPLPDFRTVDGGHLEKASPNLRDTIDYVTECQDWYRDYVKDNIGERNDFVGCLIGIDDPKKAARLVSDRLSIDQIRKNASSRSSFVTCLTRKIEELGICVMRSGIVRLNTKRRLDPDEFRGFVLSDDYAPFIFINSKDALAGQAFTLIHELVHIGKNDSGISGYSLHAEKEKFANKVAGIVLIPDSVLPNDIEISQESVDDLVENADRLSKKLKISSWAVLTRLRTQKRISEDQYRTAVVEIKKRRLEKPRSNSAADFYLTRGAALGRNFSRALISSVKSGSMLYRDMWMLSGIKPKAIDKYAQEIALAGV